MSTLRWVLAGMLLCWNVGLTGCGSSGGGDQDVAADVCSCDPDASCTASAEECQAPIACTTDNDCEDYNKCTAGTCTEGFCVFTWQAGEGCCQVDMDCNLNACVVGTCDQGVCAYQLPDPTCCVNASDCDDLDPCTDDSCTLGKCVNKTKEGCCRADVDCMDTNPCTTDKCIKGLGICIHPTDSSVGGCSCVSTDQCEDLNQCTLDKCLSGQCVYEEFTNLGAPVPGCCSTAEDCNDNDPTTIDDCVYNTCTNTHQASCRFDSQCNDNNICTQDICQDGHCVIEGNVIPGCCAAAAECEDNNPCTTETCVDGKCIYEPQVTQAGCCNADAQCNDKVDCTLDKCVNFRCDWIPQTDGCCHDEGDCPQATKPCQIAICQNGVCGFTTGTNCCQTAADCNDNDVCTTDDCTNKQCFYFPVNDCCTDNVDCDDTNPCTTDACIDNKCKNTIVQNCCNNAGQCNDSDPCTIDKCENSVCVYVPKEDCCHSDGECEPLVPCQVAHCVNGNCVMENPNGCCASDNDCNDNDPECTVDHCVNNKCVFDLVDEVGCCLTASDCDTVAPCLEVTCKANHKCDYQTIPPPLCCEADADCDDTDDTCTVDSCVANTCVYDLTLEPNCCLTGDDCDSPDICQEPVCGTNHQCSFPAIPNCCHNTAECDDGDDICTDDACENDRCVHYYTGAQGCCEADSDCPNPDPCQTVKCNLGTGNCEYTDIPAPACCHNDLECDDTDNVCTVDTCVDNKCKYTYTGEPGCCEPFTYAVNFDDGTAGTLVIANGFNADEMLGGLGMLLGMLGGEGLLDLTIGWQPADGCGTHSPEYALYYGIAEAIDVTLAVIPACTYTVDIMSLLGGGIGGLPFPIDIGDMLGDMNNSGTVTTPELVLPAGQPYHLNFWVMADLVADPVKDVFEVRVIDGENTVKVWDKAMLTGGVGPDFKQVSIDLGDTYAGKTVKIQFFFDAAGSTPVGKGVAVDDISITADCNP